MDRVAARFAVHQRGLLTTDQAHEAGFSDKAILHRVDTGRWGRMHPRVFRIAGSESSWEQALLAAVLAAGEGAVASHRAAAVMWGIEGLEPLLDVAVPRAHNPRVRGAIIHRTDGLLLPERTRLRKIPLTTPPRTVFDLATVLPRGALDRVLEEVLSRRLFPRSALVEMLARHGGPGRRRTIVLQELLEEHPERWERASGRFERRLLRFLKARGFREPALQYKVELPNGRDAYVDFAYPDRMVGLEADSYRWHTSKPAWARNQTRNQLLTAMGWRIIPITWEQLTRHGDDLANVISTALWESADL